MTAEPEECLVTTAAELAVCCTHLAGCPRIGLDIEFVGEDHYHPQLCLVQVATPEQLYVIDPFSVGPLEDFWKLLVSPGHQVIVHAGREEVRLCRRASGQAPDKLFDLQIAAGLVGLGYPLGHGPLVGQLLGVHLSKVETLTEWRHRPLTSSQIRYALDDVRYLLDLEAQLSQRLTSLKRQAWAEEEFTRFIADVSIDGPALENAKWRKLKGIGSLDRRRLAIVRELFAWRDEEAARLNRPPRTVVRDDLLIEIARRNPTKDRDLHVVRGLAKRHARDLVAAVERARALPLEQCPRPAERDRDPSQVALVVSVLNAVLQDFAVRRQLSASVVATSSDVKELVRTHMVGTELPEDSIWRRGWRAEFVLPELRDILEGKRAIRIGDLACDAPFAFVPVN
ncbi:MAG: ribonuclease D [Planctomycetes bacterium]|nr:ribonuclease D [Planctomycetota bacterium]